MLQRGTTSTTTAVVPEMEEHEQYVKLGSRFFRVKSHGDVSRRLHYLDSCFLCKKDIASDRDIFMYKGDAAFCSEDCRLDQIEMDEALDAVARRHRLLSSAGAAVAIGDASGSPMMMRRRPTIANLAARNPPVAAT
ncbi:hypothetical protein PR202_ga14374 [Eleusine coracana subsp. coracana]|uniref:FLZ-type domain-containing protein n=1 Tax=Eleusine coracana subsp. coracana TaxID=191504 RepID=A0AAV5CHE0_ELECO|nr:hypothetical protein PR202_ga14374 [Eleusine coracana subsp. coracana]